MKNTIGRKISTAFSILIMFSIFLLLFVFTRLIKDAHVTITLDEMQGKTRFVEKYITAKYNRFDIDNEIIVDEIRDLSEMTGLRITFIDREGTVIADSEIANPSLLDNHKFRDEIQQAATSGKGHSIRYSKSIQTDMLYYAQNYGRFYLRLAKPMQQMNKDLIRVSTTMFYIGLFLLIVSFLIVFFITSSVTQPIKETISFASQFAAGDYSKRIIDYSDNEIGMIQHSLNNMAEQLAERMDLLIFEQNKLKITIESIEDGIVVIDSEKKIVIVNRAFHKILEISDLTATGYLYFEMIRNRNLNRKIEDALNYSETQRFDDTFVNGRVYDICITPISEKFILQGILVILRDVTEKKKIEQMKTELVGNMSHELKTPITIIKGYLETIKENIKDTAMCSVFIRKAIENADRQNSIVNDIIKLNMIETSSEFFAEYVVLDELLSGCVSILEHKAQQKEVVLLPSLGTSSHKTRCNKFLAEETFFNLIDNAINYNRPGGKVFIESRIEGDKYIVDIRDTGIGIPSDSIGRIFERFYRVDKSRSRETGGTGLGLSIVKHAALILGWEIKVESDTSGSMFSVIIA